jgi:predicted neutral ceramidase superfamily lipid hydrolase
MLLRGEDVAEGLRDWVKSELKEGPRQAYDLGKFFFTVSIGTVGAIATIEKLNTRSAVASHMWTSLLLLTISAVVALFLAFPRVQKVGGETELFAKYKAQVRLIQVVVILWALLWLAGLLFGACAVRS